MSAADKDLHCSFCSKDATEVKRLIAGPSIYICDECVELCYSLLDGHMPKDIEGKKSEEKSPESEEKPVKEIISPREIKEHLDQYIIGQDYAKTVVAVAVHNHYKRLENPVIDDVEIDKSNILLAGPTGVGKTFIAQTIARILDVPFVIADATSLTEAGYVGDDVESIITKLLQAAGGDVAKCERGIVYLDEIDKKQKRGGGGNSKDVNGEGVQQALLKIIEGTELMVPVSGSKKTLTVETVKVNTKNILFIVGGAFVGLDKVVNESLNKNKGIGFSNTLMEDKPTNELLKKVKPEHLVGFGLIPELIGRLPVLAPLEDLSEDQLVRVLTEPKNSVVKQFQKMFELSGVELEFTDEALRTVARNAKDVKTGARGLRGILESSLIHTQFNLTDYREKGATKIIVDEKVINEEAEPEIVYAHKRKPRAKPKPNNEEQI